MAPMSVDALNCADERAEVRAKERPISHERTYRQTHRALLERWSVATVFDTLYAAGGSRCGPFVATFMFLLLGRPPTSADLTGRASGMLRLAIYDIVSTGHVYAALSPSALHVPLGAGKPARLELAVAQEALYEAEHNRLYADKRAAADIAPSADGRWADKLDMRGAAAGAGRNAAVATPAAKRKRIFVYDCDLKTLLLAVAAACRRCCRRHLAKNES